MKKRNPWIGALWTIGIALVVAAWASVVWQSTFYYQNVDPQGVGPVVEFLQRLADTLSHPALFVGFATIVGLLFLHAGNHARKAARDSSR